MGTGDKGPCQLERRCDGLPTGNNRRSLKEGADFQSQCKPFQDDHTDYHLEWERASEGSCRNLEKWE